MIPVSDEFGGYGSEAPSDQGRDCFDNTKNNTGSKCFGDARFMKDSSLADTSGKRIG